MGGVYPGAQITVRTAEEDVFAGGFEEVVVDGEVSEAVAAYNGHGFLTCAVNLGYIAVFDGDVVTAVEADAMQAGGLIGDGSGPAVDIAAIENEVLGHQTDGVLGAGIVAQSDQAGIG